MDPLKARKLETSRRTSIPRLLHAGFRHETQHGRIIKNEKPVAFKTLSMSDRRGPPELRFVGHQSGNELLEFDETLFQLFHLIGILFAIFLSPGVRRRVFWGRA